MPNETIGEEEKPTPTQSLEETEVVETQPEVNQEQKNIDEEAQKKAEHLANLQKAIDLANEELKTVRKGIKEVKTQNQPGQEELPQIDKEDPNSKAWLNEIDGKVSPVQQELEQEKQEIRSFALREFLTDKPLLAKDSEKVKQLISTYESLSKGKISEKTKEGVLLYLDKAYAAENHDELLAVAGQKRVDKAKADIAFSDIAISRGAGGYPSQPETDINLSADDLAVLAKWGVTPDEYKGMVKKQKAKK
jgi:hypothetical protein